MLGQVFENLISYPLLPGSYPVVDFDSVAASRIQAVSQFYELSVFISVGPVPGAWTRPSKHFLSDLWVDWVGDNVFIFDHVVLGVSSSCVLSVMESAVVISCSLLT